MTYGCETWSLSNTQFEKLVTTPRKMERIMVAVTLKTHSGLALPYGVIICCFRFPRDAIWHKETDFPIYLLVIRSFFLHASALLCTQWVPDRTYSIRYQLTAG